MALPLDQLGSPPGWFLDMIANSPRMILVRLHSVTLEEAVVGDIVDEVFASGGVLSRSLGEVYQVRRGQMAMARAWNSAIENGDSLLAEGPTGCHAPGQRVLMFNGSLRRVEDVTVGDLLMGPDSRPREVLKLTRGSHSMVRVEPVKGDPWTVTSDHVVTLAKTGTGELKDVRLDEWQEWGATQKHLWKLVRTGVDFQPRVGFQRELPLDPYFLGALLGDGTLGLAGSICVTKPDPEILELMEEQAAQHGMIVRHSEGREYQHYITGGYGSGSRTNPIAAALRTMGLWKHESGDKFIPEPYKVSSRESRLQLLAGLVDTDGSYDHCYDYVSKSLYLADDIMFLARSLGLAAYMSPCTKSCQDGFEGDYYRVIISGDLDIVPCRIPRKQALRREQKKSVLRTGFKVSPAGESEFFGFTVSGDQRYLLDDFTITHNCGKSYAYLIPATYHASKWREDKESKNEDAVVGSSRVVVATANISLQEQLVNKDLPALQAVLPWDFTYALLKGRSNYLCLSKVISGELLNAPGSGSDAVHKLLGWSDTTVTGDKSELDFDPGPAWGYCSSTSDECPGSRCAHSVLCHANRARNHAMAQDVIVTNYHVLLLSQRLMTNYRVLVCDEAHNLAQIARSALGWDISLGSFKAVARWIQRGNSDEEQAGVALWEYAEELMEAVKNSLGKGRTTRLYDWNQVGYKTKGLLAAISKCHGIADIRENAAGAAGKTKEQTRAMMMGKRLSNLYIRLETISTSAFGGWVYWTQDHKSRGPMLSAAPVELDTILPDIIFDNAQSVLLTSATMTSNRSFDFIRAELGLEDAYEMIAASPFDLKKQGVIVVPRDMPPPPSGRDREGELEWLNAVTARAIELIEMCQGRTLLLFTSWKTLNYVASNLHVQYPVLKQGDMPTTKLVELFKRDVDSVLLGVASLWEGVDVPGEALTGLLIDKIPFPVPVDPIVEAASELVEKRGGNSFFDFSLPKATISLCQGIGRLIRSTTDRGVVVITDRRLIDKRYGEKMIRSLPPFWKTQNMRDAWKMLEERNGR